MSITLTITSTTTGESKIVTLHDSPDWTALVNRAISRKMGVAAARNRQDIHETEHPTRSWAGVINGGMYTITENPRHPALASVAESATKAAESVAQLTAAQLTRDETVRAALASGVSVNDLVPASGLTRARIYQIRDNRR